MLHAPLGPTPGPAPSSPSIAPLPSRPPGLGPLLTHLADRLPSTPWLAGTALLAALLWLVGYWRLLRWRHQLLLRRSRQLTILPPPEVQPAGAAQFWATAYGTLHRTWWRRLIYGTPHLAYEYRWAGRALSITVWVPGTVAAAAIAAAARAAWPGATVTVADTPTAPIPDTDTATATGGALLPVLAEAYPLRTDHDTDPLRQLVAAGTGLRHHEHACIQILARPASPRRVARLRRAPAQLRDPAATRGLDAAAPLRWILDALTPGPSTTTAGRERSRPAGADPARDRDVRATVDKVAAGPHWETSIRYAAATASPRGEASPALTERVTGLAGAIAASFAVYTAANRLRRVRVRHPVEVLARRRLRHGFLLSTPELAAMAGLPTDLAVPGLTRARAKAIPAPIQVPSGGRGTITLGRAQVGGHAVALPVADGRYHTHIEGSTGSGKTTQLLHISLATIKAGRGLVVVDPKGDLVTDILDRLPFEYADKIVLLDPAQDPPPAFNPLQGDDDDLVVDNIVSIFGKIYARHWGPRIDDILRSALLTLMSRANPMLTLVPPLLTDRQLRAQLTAKLGDPAGLGGFWSWYDSLPEGIRAQAVGPVLARLRAMLLRRFVRRVVGQPHSSFDMNDVLDGAILLCRLPKGVLGDDTTKLLGSFVVASVWQAATARSNLPEPTRRDAVLVIDECQNFLNLPRSIDEICAEARGYRLSLVLAHQNLATTAPRNRGGDLRELPQQDLLHLLAGRRPGPRPTHPARTRRVRPVPPRRLHRRRPPRRQRGRDTGVHPRHQPATTDRGQRRGDPGPLRPAHRRAPTHRPTGQRPAGRAAPRRRPARPPVRPAAGPPPAAGTTNGRQLTYPAAGPAAGPA